MKKENIPDKGKVRCLNNAFYSEGTIVDFEMQDGRASFLDKNGKWDGWSFEEGNETFWKNFELVQEEFILPERWCIKQNNYQEVLDYSNKYGMVKPYKFGEFSNLHYHHYPPFQDAYTTSNKIEEGYTEITFEQFKKYVLKEDYKEDMSYLINILKSIEYE